MLDYGEAIKNIFNKKKKKKNYSQLNSIPSLHSLENLSLRTKEKSKENKLEEDKNNNLKIENKKETEKINKNQIFNDNELQNFSFIEENKEINFDKLDYLNIKIEKEKNGNSFINYSLETSNKNPKKNKKKNDKSRNILYYNNNNNKILSKENGIQNLITYENEINDTKKSKNNSFSKNQLNHFNKYNLEELAYNAIKDYSSCKPNNNDFLSRMQFYSIKKQTESKIINIMIRKQTPKIKESEKIITFNRLIEDANRRLVKKNQMLINENINEKKNNENKKKFNQIDFENKYNEKITQRLKEKELKLELLRNQKKKKKKIKKI